MPDKEESREKIFAPVQKAFDKAKKLFMEVEELDIYEVLRILRDDIFRYEDALREKNKDEDVEAIMKVGQSASAKLNKGEV